MVKLGGMTWHKQITHEQELDICEKYIKKIPMSDILNEYGIYYKLVAKILEKHNIPITNNFVSEELKTLIKQEFDGGNKNKRALARKHLLSSTTIDKIVAPAPLLTGLTRLQKSQWLKDNAKYVLDMYDTGSTTRELALELGIDKKSILNSLREGGVNFRGKSERQRTYTVNDSIFEKIDTHEKAYWLGFLAGDGCNTGRNISISLKREDKEHLQKFGNFMGSNAPIYDTIKIDKEGKMFPGNRITIACQKIANDLAKLGIVQRKTFCYEFPKFLDEQFYSSFILGLIDSDGCFNYSKSGKDTISLNINFIGTNDCVSHVAKILEKYCNLNTVTIVKRKENESNYIFQIGGNLQLTRIVKYLYSQSPTCLNRKKIKAISLLANRYTDDSWLQNQLQSLNNLTLPQKSQA
jgi:hypothetical protein